MTEVEGLKTLVVYKPEAYWVRQIFEWYVYGDGEKARLSLAAVARKLEHHGVLSPADQGNVPVKKRRPRGSWNATSVREILINPVHMGRWTFNASSGEIVVKVPAIVDEATFNAAQRRLDENKRLGGNVKYPYLLRGRIFCGQCGYRMHGKPIRTYFYYRCPAANRKDMAVECGARLVRADRLDPRVWMLVKAVFSDDRLVQEKIAQYQNEAANTHQPLSQILSRLDQQAVEHTARLERLIDLHLDGHYTAEIVAKRQQRIEDALSELAAERGRIGRKLEAVDPSRLNDIIELAATVRKRLNFLSNPKGRRWVVDTMDVCATVGAERHAEITAHGVPIGTVSCD